MFHKFPIVVAATMLASCSPSMVNAGGTESKSRPFDTLEVAHFNEPWAMTFLPEFNRALITEKGGTLMLWEWEGAVTAVAGVPAVVNSGQGGLGDVVLDPNFAENRLVYLSYAEAGEGGSGAAVASARLDTDSANPTLRDVQVIWRQSPKVSGSGHFGHRIAFSPDGKYLFISSGERQKFDPAQDMNANLGKVVRLNIDGTTPKDNPFYDSAKPVQSQIWSLGHRNPLGLAFDGNGQLWDSEMGPQGGDEVNLVKRGTNYGYPKASNGSHYGGGDIPDHKPSDGFEAPAAWWNPSISPGSLAFYGGDLFPSWKNSLLVGALGGQALIRLKIEGANASKADHWPFDARIREVEVAPDGSVWLLEDGPKGRLLKLTPKAN